MRQRPVPAQPLDRHFHNINRSGNGTRPHRNLPGFIAWNIMQRKHRITGKTLEQPLLDHALGPADVFFSRLKNQVHRAVKILHLGQVTRRTEQHGGVPIMATGVHLAGGARGIGQVAGFMNGQRIHVSTDTHGTPAAPFD
jgi:hypothetical protein